MIRNSSIEDFECALEHLDYRLGEQKISKIQIRAIGGFAMMYYRVREHGYTIDIDSLTEDYDETVISAIKYVGREMNLEDDWLNTDCAMLEGFIDELANEIDWRETKYHFQHINLLVADEIGLLRSKAKAIHDGGLVPRSTDKKDLIALLNWIGVCNLNELNQDEKLEFIREKYPRCYDYLRMIEKW